MTMKTFLIVTSIGIVIFNCFIYYNKTVRNDEFLRPNLNRLNYKFHPLLPHDDYVYERILNTNSSDYIWVGNHWMPPPGVPTFNPRQLKEYYSRRNILVIGDSTGRRMYTTLYKVMQAAHLKDMTIGKIDGDSWNLTNICDRYISTLRESLCLNHTHVTEIRDVKRNETMIKDIKFDFIFSPCYNGLEKTWKDEAALTKLSKDYDLIIIAMGIWEHTKTICRSDNATAGERLQTSLEVMARTNPPGLQLVFRNCGFTTEMKTDNVIRNANAVAGQFFHDLDQKWELGRYERNMTLVDWGGGMESRSYGKNRISGDTTQHYGLEARLLAIQQITHELLKSDLSTRDVLKME